MLSPSERSIRARIGAYSLHAQRDPRETTAAARRVFLGRFLEDIPQDLPEDERLRRAAAARHAHFSRLALKSVQARRRRRNGGGA
jgi:hypothetical protein